MNWTHGSFQSAANSQVIGGANSIARARTSWAPCLTQPCVACRHCPVFVSRACRGWRTSPCGPRLAEQRRGPPAFAHAYDVNRKAAFETNPVAVCIRRLIAKRTSRAGAASDLLRVATYLAGDDISKKGADWPKHPGALAGRLRRVQTPLRMLGIEICFSRRKRDVPDPRAVVLGRLQIHYR
jgi:hypothetical protein